jgi:hypothetical protein
MVLSSDGLVFKSSTASAQDKVVGAVIVIVLVTGSMAMLVSGFFIRRCRKDDEQVIKVDDFTVQGQNGEWNINLKSPVNDPSLLDSVTLSLKQSRRGSTRNVRLSSGGTSESIFVGNTLVGGPSTTGLATTTTAEYPAPASTLRTTEAGTADVQLVKLDSISTSGNTAQLDSIVTTAKPV